MIDQLREQIQKRLEELSSEAERLRNALAALEHRAGSAVRERKASVRRRPRATATPAASASAAEPASPPSPAPTSARSTRRKAPGSTKAAVLEALAGGEAMTASEVAAKAGLGRATVSTTLSKLAAGGEVEKAERGYRLPSARTATAA